MYVVCVVHVIALPSICPAKVLYLVCVCSCDAYLSVSGTVSLYVEMKAPTTLLGNIIGHCLDIADILQH